jgi:PmbA protein
MTYEEFKNLVISKAKERGITDYEIYYQKESEFQISSSNRELGNYKDASSMGVSFKALLKGKAGYSSTEEFTEKSAEELVDNAIENLNIIQSDDEEFIFDGKGEYKEIKTYYGEMDNLSVEDKISMVRSVEDKMLSFDKRIVNTPYNFLVHGTREVSITNSKGLDKSFKADNGALIAMALASEGKAPKSATKVKYVKTFKGLNLEDFASDVAREAISKLNSKTVKSGEYRILMRRDAARSLLGTFTSMFSAENVQKGLSILKGRLNTKIGSDLVNIIDDPFSEVGVSNRPFDDEGVPTTRKNIIENGVLKTFLYDLKAAHKDGTHSTGNAIKYGYTGKATIMPINFVLENGELSFDDLLHELKDGLVITDLQGMHSGANPISGEFSLSAEGFLVENGEIVSGVEQITIASNFLDVLDNIIAVGNDVEVGGNIISPSFIVKSMMVAGK